MNWLQHRVRPEQIRELSLLLLIIAAVIFFGSLIDSYYTSRTFNRIASSVAIIAVVAVGQTLVVLTRNIDLSVGSIVGFTAYFVGTTIAGDNSIHPLVAVLLAVALGGCHGRDQRRHRRLGPRAVDHRHARHAGHLSRHTDRVFRRQDRHHRQPAGLADRPAARSTSSSSAASRSVSWSRWRSSASSSSRSAPAT